jgi:hypothetical protein
MAIAKVEGINLSSGRQTVVTLYRLPGS